MQSTQYFYQIAGYKGHLKSQYWITKVNWPHEYAQEEPAKEAIAGADSPLWVKKDAEGNPITPFIELVMGVRSWGAISLLTIQDDFVHYVMPRLGFSGPTRGCPLPYPSTAYESLSPIRFEKADELKEMLERLRPVKPSKKGDDDSKLNKGFPQKFPKPGRAQFEQMRLLWHILQGGRTELPAMYGLVSPPLNLRLAYFSHTLWIDPSTFSIINSEDDECLDFGWFEPGSGNTRHFIIEELSSMTKGSLDKSVFLHGESQTVSESVLPSTLTSLFTGSDPRAPLVLITHDWERTNRFLSAHKIDTSTWRQGVGEILGFGPVNSGTTPLARSNDWRATTEFETKFKPEIKEEKPKPYAGRYDPSPSNRRRSLSPRSRTRPLAKVKDEPRVPIFRPDEDEGEEGEIPETDNATCDVTGASTFPKVHVIDLRELFRTLIGMDRPFILYPPMAHRLGIKVDGWCAGNQARQMHDVLGLLVGGKPIFQRQDELKATPGLPPPSRAPASGPLGNVPVVLEGIAGAKKAAAAAVEPAIWDDDDDDDGW